MAQVIAWEFGICYYKDHVSRLLKESGWTPQIPSTRAIQRDESVIARWASRPTRSQAVRRLRLSESEDVNPASQAVGVIVRNWVGESDVAIMRVRLDERGVETAARVCG